MAGSGTMRERAPGVWELRVAVGKDLATGQHRQISRTFRGGRRDAGKALSALASKYRASTGATMAFRDHTEEWLAGARLSPTTRVRYRSLLDLHILPAVGDTRLAKLTAWELDQLYAHMAAKAGLSPASIRQAHAIIRRSLGQALKWDRVDLNVATKATPPPLVNELRPIPDAESVRKLLQTAAGLDERMGAFIWLTAASGARRGEVCGLQWRHVNWETEELLVEQAVIEDGGRLTVKDVKTHGKRRLALDAGTLEVLRYHRARNDALAGSFATVLGPDAFVFSAEPDGSRPPHPDAATWAFKKIHRAAGLPHFTLHGLRHWMVTTGLVAGQDVRTVAGRAGHKDASVTLRVYAHFLQTADRGLAEHLGRALGPGPARDAAPSGDGAGVLTG